MPYHFLQIADHVSPNLQRISPNRFLQITDHVSPNLQRISPNMFLQIADHVSPNLQRISPSRFLQIADHISLNFQRISPHVFSKNVEHFTPNLQKRFHGPASSILSFLFSSEKTQSSIPPYTCHGLRTLRYGWRLWFLGHACSSYTSTGSALDVMDCGPAKAESSAQI